ncbi:hypothetical protein H7X46_21005 [Pseudonocardia sp. C8]|uniref:hypothetical protein n=1 Tax=Pseudonocardia sp. C8 TaxID=2762759 RepID=UPI001642F915|nr:hypothetical protein [Pseudonocardia sp. C8]MBC3193541.1 hypothetical protein [Pseudonocardia sp. C8]
MLRDRPDARRPAPRGGSGRPALVSAALGTGLVAVAVALLIAGPPTMWGLALVCAGLMLDGVGLVLGTIGAVRGPRRGNRIPVSAAGVAVAGLAGGLIWLAVFVIVTLGGGGTADPAPAGGTLACAPASCHAD